MNISVDGVGFDVMDTQWTVNKYNISVVELIVENDANQVRFSISLQPAV